MNITPARYIARWGSLRIGSMDQPQPTELSSLWRGRLAVALIVLAAFAVLAGVGIGITLHGWSENLDSLRHWQAKLEEEVGTSSGQTPRTGLDSPSVRIRRIEAELDAVPERLFLLGGMFALMSVFVVLGYRKLRAGR